jgi:hypothetical protein
MPGAAHGTNRIARRAPDLDADRDRHRAGSPLSSSDPKPPRGGCVYLRDGGGQYLGAGLVGEIMTPARIALVLLVSACGGGAPAPAKTAGGAASSAGDASGCPPAYAEYERRWRTARGQELAAGPNAFRPAEIEEMVSDEVKTLPDRDELAKLRLMYSLVEVFIPDAPWVLAFDAAERAIAVCGEKAHRPA